MLTNISVGAVGAAFVAALVSVLGLIISKENKVSEFRQAWIDALRTEITTYLTSINMICDALQVNYESQGQKVDALSTHYSSLNSANFMISLRLNTDERESREIISSMRNFQELLSNDSDVTPESLRAIEARFLKASKSLLKKEWKRVKRGEPTFALAKFAALALVVAIAIGSSSLWLEGSDLVFEKQQGSSFEQQRTDVTLGDLESSHVGGSEEDSE